MSWLWEIPPKRKYLKPETFIITIKDKVKFTESGYDKFYFVDKNDVFHRLQLTPEYVYMWNNIQVGDKVKVIKTVRNAETEYEFYICDYEVIK